MAPWLFRALLSAGFAAATAILDTAGVSSGAATVVRTLAAALGLLLPATDQVGVVRVAVG